MRTSDIIRLTGKELSLAEALAMAFDAGAAWAVGDHKDFQQIHENRETVVQALAPRVNRRTPKE